MESEYAVLILIYFYLDNDSSRFMYSKLRNIMTFETEDEPLLSPIALLSARFDEHVRVENPQTSSPVEMSPLLQRGSSVLFSGSLPVSEPAQELESVGDWETTSNKLVNAPQSKSRLRRYSSGSRESLQPEKTFEASSKISSAGRVLKD